MSHNHYTMPDSRIGSSSTLATFAQDETHTKEKVHNKNTLPWEIIFFVLSKLTSTLSKLTYILIPNSVDSVLTL